MNSIIKKTLKAEILKAEMGRIAAPEWCALAPVGERRFLSGLARMMQSARRSKSPNVARAAVKSRKRKVESSNEITFHASRSTLHAPRFTFSLVRGP
jgi:hypothetical protein